MRWNKSPPAPLPETVGIGFLRSGTSFTSLTAETSLLVFVRVSHLESRVAKGISAAQVARAAPGSCGDTEGAASSELRWDYRLLTLDDTSCFQHVAHLVSQTHARISPRRSRTPSPCTCSPARAVELAVAAHRTVAFPLSGRKQPHRREMCVFNRMNVGRIHPEHPIWLNLLSS